MAVTLVVTSPYIFIHHVDLVPGLSIDAITYGGLDTVALFSMTWNLVLCSVAVEIGELAGELALVGAQEAAFVGLGKFS